MYALVLSSVARLRDRVRDWVHGAVMLLVGVPVTVGVTWCAGAVLAYALVRAGLPLQKSAAPSPAALSPLMYVVQYFLAFFFLGAVGLFVLLYLLTLLGAGYERWHEQARDCLHEETGPGLFSQALPVLSRLALACLAAVALQLLVGPALAAAMGLALADWNDPGARCRGTLYSVTVEGCRNYTAACACANEGLMPLLALAVFVMLVLWVYAMCGAGRDRMR